MISNRQFLVILPLFLQTAMAIINMLIEPEFPARGTFLFPSEIDPFFSSESSHQKSRPKPPDLHATRNNFQRSR